MSCNKFWGTSDNMWQLWHQYRWLTRQRWISYDIFALEHKLANQAHVQLASNSRFSCSAPSHLGIFRCCNAFSCACNRVRVFVCVYPAQYALITCECHVPSITFPYHQHWHKGNALYYMVRDIREATVAPLRRMKAMKAANQRYQRYCSRHKVLAPQIHWASGRVDFSAAQHQAEGISGQACLTAWTRSCRQLQQLAQKRQTEHHVFRERVPWQER